MTLRPPLMSVVSESKLTLRLALPLMIGQLSQMLLGVADTFMVGHLGVTELATLTFVNSIFFLPFVFGIGLLTCISVHSAHVSGVSPRMVTFYLTVGEVRVEFAHGSTTSICLSGRGVSCDGAGRCRVKGYTSRDTEKELIPHGF